MLVSLDVWRVAGSPSSTAARTQVRVSREACVLNSESGACAVIKCVLIGPVLHLATPTFKRSATPFTALDCLVRRPYT